MSAVRDLLADFRREYGRQAYLWRAEDGAWILVESTGGEPPDTPDAGAVELDGSRSRYRLVVDPPYTGKAQATARFLASALGKVLRLDGEVRVMSNEIAERYEEITLLYSISETLGSVISLEDAAHTILEEVIATVGAKRAALWVHDPARDQLYLAASVGMEGQSGPIRVDDRASVTAEVFRTRSAVIMDPDDVYPRGEYDKGITRRGYFMSVPVSYTPPQGETRTVGVINLVGRISNEPYSAGDVKLVSAVASQVGAAVENGRLVAESLRQERLVRELELAHDLQLKLLPDAAQFSDYAQVAARCIPAESVGGDFYHLFRLSGGRIGVMIGDVSSHGFSAALIMALTMSAVAIHASEGDPPSEVLRRVHRALIDELETTEMFLTLFYGVIDPGAGRVTYANAGHHHAFRVTAAGTSERLGVTNPPLGMIDLDYYAEASTPWEPGRDLLLLFTDGLPDALEAGEREGERGVLELVSRGRDLPLNELIDQLFALTAPGASSSAGIDDRTALLLRL